MVVVTLASAYEGGLDFDQYIRDGALEMLVRMESTSEIVASGDLIGEATLRAGFYDLPRVIAASLGATLTNVCFSRECWWLRPHAKTQVTIEYVKHADGSVAPSKIHTIIISAQHVEPMTSALGEELERDTFVVQTDSTKLKRHAQSNHRKSCEENFVYNYIGKRQVCFDSVWQRNVQLLELNEQECHRRPRRSNLAVGI